MGYKKINLQTKCYKIVYQIRMLVEAFKEVRNMMTYILVVQSKGKNANKRIDNIWKSNHLQTKGWK